MFTINNIFINTVSRFGGILFRVCLKQFFELIEYRPKIVKSVCYNT